MSETKQNKTQTWSTPSFMDHMQCGITAAENGRQNSTITRDFSLILTGVYS
jgi:hypothetical protein